MVLTSRWLVREYAPGLSEHAAQTPRSCSKGCYGGRVQDGRQPYRFAGVRTAGKPPRVYTYRKAIGNGTPLAAAERAVLALLPPDIKTTSFWIERNDGQSNSCAFWNLHSRKLASLLASYYHPKTATGLGSPSKPGDIGVVLGAVRTSGYEVRIAAARIVGTVYLSPTTFPTRR